MVHSHNTQTAHQVPNSVRKLKPNSKPVSTTGSPDGALGLLSVVCQQELRKQGKILPPRCLNKAGDLRLEVINADEEKERFYKDIFTTLVEIKWRWLLVAICAAHMGSWLIFACLWYIVLQLHGDISHFEDPDWKPCITNINNFVTAFLFSLETQHTTGYGYYHINDNCPQAISILCIQSVIGVMLEGTLVGLLFVKMTASRHRNATIAFSQTAVICQRDGKLTLMFRVGDLRTKTHLLRANIQAQVVRRKTTLEGEVVDFHQDDLKISSCNEKQGSILLLWPTTVSHVIDNTSPLYYLQPSDLTEENNKFEIIIVLEGTVEATGLEVQARTSYMPSEIRWGKRFEELTLTKSPLTGQRIIDYARFNTTVPITTPKMSAAEFDSIMTTKK